MTDSTGRPRSSSTPSHPTYTLTYTHSRSAHTVHPSPADRQISLHGSLAATGLGHMTPHAVLLGLTGDDPESVRVGRLAVIMDEVKAVEEIEVGLAGGERRRLKFDLGRDLVSLPLSLSRRRPG